MDGFHTFASNRCGLSFSAFELAAARSSSLAATEKVRVMLTANQRNVALHPGGFFTARSLGNASMGSQARRLLSSFPKVSGRWTFPFRHISIAPRVDSLSAVKVRDGEVAMANPIYRGGPRSRKIPAQLGAAYGFISLARAAWRRSPPSHCHRDCASVMPA